MASRRGRKRCPAGERFLGCTRACLPASVIGLRARAPATRRTLLIAPARSTECRVSISKAEHGVEPRKGELVEMAPCLAFHLTNRSCICSFALEQREQNVCSVPKQNCEAKPWGRRITARSTDRRKSRAAEDRSNDLRSRLRSRFVFRHFFTRRDRKIKNENEDSAPIEADIYSCKPYPLVLRILASLLFPSIPPEISLHSTGNPSLNKSKTSSASYRNFDV